MRPLSGVVGGHFEEKSEKAEKLVYIVYTVIPRLLTFDPLPWLLG